MIITKSFQKLLKLKRSFMSLFSIWLIPTHSYYYISLLHGHAESSEANLSYFKPNTTDIGQEITAMSQSRRLGVNYKVPSSGLLFTESFT